LHRRRGVGAAKAGYRFYGYEAVADLLTGAAAVRPTADDLDEDLSEEEGTFNRSYSALFPDDGHLAEGLNGPLG
jgi:hypothetical protein